MDTTQALRAKLLETAAWRQEMRAFGADVQALERRCAELEQRRLSYSYTILGWEGVALFVLVGEGYPEALDELLEASITGRFWQVVGPISGLFLDYAVSLPGPRGEALALRLFRGLARFEALGSAYDHPRAQVRAVLERHPAQTRAAVEALLGETRQGPGASMIQEALLKLWMAVGPQDVPPPRMDPWIVEAAELFFVTTPQPSEATALRALPLERREAVLLATQSLLWPLLPLAPTPAVMDRAVHGLAVEGLGAMSGPSFLALIEDTLVALGPEVVPRLVARFASSPKPPWVALLPALKRLDDPRAAALLGLALGEKREALRRSAIEVFASLGPSPELQAVLTRALTDKKPRVREAAVQVALAWGEAGEPLLEPLRRSESDEAVLAALGSQPRAKSVWAARWEEAERLRATPPSPSHEARWRESVRSAWGSAWSAHLDDGLPFLVYLSQGMESRFYSRVTGGLLGAWYGALRHFAHEPLALVLGLEHLRASPSDGPRAYTDFLIEVFGDSLVEPATYMLLYKPPTHRQALYEWLCGKPSHQGEARALHLATLEDDSEWMREQAARVVSSWGAECLPEVLPKLASSKATTRHSVAAVLRRVGSEDALPAIQAALAKEKSQKVAAELEAARAECDPFLRTMRSRAASLGAYRFSDPFDANEALTELRGVLYIDVANPPSWERWLRLWDLLERFGEAGCLPMALDYAKGNGVEAWPAEHRKALWGAAGLPGVSPLTTGVAGPGVISVARFAQPAARAAFFKERLPMEERGVRARRFVPDDAGIFLRCVEVGWAWCERQGIPLDHLDVRVDGGTVREKYAGGADSTAIELRGGFAVELFRDSARREGDLRNGVRWLRVRVPKNHPLRAERGMTPRDRFLDLRGELGAEIGPGLV